MKKRFNFCMFVVYTTWVLSLVSIVVGTLCVRNGLQLEGFMLIGLAFIVCMCVLMTNMLLLTRKTTQVYEERGMIYRAFDASLRFNDIAIDDGRMILYARGIGFQKDGRDEMEFIPSKEFKNLSRCGSTISVIYSHEGKIRNRMFVLHDEEQAMAALSYVNQ